MHPDQRPTENQPGRPTLETITQLLMGISEVSAVAQRSITNEQARELAGQLRNSIDAFNAGKADPIDSAHPQILNKNIASIILNVTQGEHTRPVRVQILQDQQSGFLSCPALEKLA